MLRSIENFHVIKERLSKKDLSSRYESINNTRFLRQGGEKAFYNEIISTRKVDKVVCMQDNSYYAYFISENYPNTEVTWLCTGATVDIERSLLRDGIKYRSQFSPIVDLHIQNIKKQDIIVFETYYGEPVLSAIALLSAIEVATKLKASQSVMYCMAPISLGRTSCLTAAWNELYSLPNVDLWMVPMLNEDQFCFVRLYVKGKISVDLDRIQKLKEYCLSANFSNRILVKGDLNSRLVKDTDVVYTQLTEHLKGVIVMLPDAMESTGYIKIEERVAVPSLLSSYNFIDIREVPDNIRPLCSIPGFGDLHADMKFMIENAKRNDIVYYVGCSNPKIPCILASLFPDVKEIHIFLCGSCYSNIDMVEPIQIDNNRVILHTEKMVISKRRPDLIICTKSSGWTHGITLASELLPRAISCDVSARLSRGGSVTKLQFNKQGISSIPKGNPRNKMLHLDGSISQKIFREHDSDECRLVSKRNVHGKFDLKLYDKKRYLQKSEAFNNRRFRYHEYMFEKDVFDFPPVVGHDRSLDFNLYHTVFRDYIQTYYADDVFKKTCRMLLSVQRQIYPHVLTCVMNRWCENIDSDYVKIWMKCWSNRLKDYKRFMDIILDTVGKRIYTKTEMIEMKQHLSDAELRC